MTYIVKTQSDGTVGVYDTIKGSYPIEGPELRAAGVGRIEGSGRYGWFSGKDDTAKAEQIAATLNAFHGHAVAAKVATERLTEAMTDAEAALAKVGAALIADEAMARA